MKKRPVLQSILISAVCVSFLCTVLFEIPGANAELATPTAGSSSAPIATEEQYCDSICPSIANSNGQLLNLSGTVGWTSADDQWCANHNSQTNPSVASSPAPLGATVPTGACNVAYYPGDTSCAQVTAGYTRCQYKNSQVESYCEAYESAKMAGTGENMLLILDIAATATCGAVCVAEMSTSLSGGMLASKAAQQACDAAAMGAGAAELLVSFEQQSSTMGKIAEGVLGAAGIAEGAMEWSKAKGSCPQSAAPTTPDTTPAVNLPALRTTKNDSQIDFHYLSANDFLATLFIPNAEAGAANPNSCKKGACITAATLAVLTGVRYYNMNWGKKSKESSCNNIWGLQSSASAIAGGITAAGYSADGGSIGATSGSSVGTTGTSAGTSAATGLNCMAGGGTVASCAGQSSAATDGGVLGSGLGNAALPLAQQLANSGLPAALGSGGLGSAMGGAMSGDGSMGNALTKVAQAAADNGKELAQVASMGGYSGGGGGGASGATAADAMANLFGNAGGPAAATAPMQVFKGDGNEDGDDIWHSHSSSNIFQIVSHRIGKINP